MFLKLRIVIILIALMLIISNAFAEDGKLVLQKALLQERLARLQAEFILAQEQLKQIEILLKTKDIDNKENKKQEVLK